MIIMRKSLKLIFGNARVFDTNNQSQNLITWNPISYQYAKMGKKLKEI